MTVMGVFPRGSGAPAPCCLTSGSLTLRSAPLCEAPRSSPAPSPPRLLSVCPIVLCPSLPHLWGSQFLFLVLLFLSQGSPFFSFPASLDLSLCPPCPPSLLSQGNSPSRLRTQRRPPSNTCHPSRKPWVPSTCAGDLRGLLMVALRSQGNWRWEGLSGLHWVWCIERGPHLQLRQEPQGTSDFRLRSQGPCRLGTGESGLVLG